MYLYVCLSFHGYLKKLPTKKTDLLRFFICMYVCTPETRFSDPRFSEILDLVNKTQLPSYFTKYPDSI